MRQQSGEAVGGTAQTDALQGRLDPVGLLRTQPGKQRPPHPLVSLHCEFEVLEHGVVFKDGGFLELAPDPGVGNLRLGQTGEVDGLTEEGLAGIRAGLARDHIHHRGLAGAVRSDDRAQFAGINRQRQFVERPETIKTDGDVLEVQDDVVRQVELPGAHHMRSAQGVVFGIPLARFVCRRFEHGCVHACAPLEAMEEEVWLAAAAGDGAP